MLVQVKHRLEALLLGIVSFLSVANDVGRLRSALIKYNQLKLRLINVSER